MDKIYLDANAYYPPIKETKEKIHELLGNYGNPSSLHSHGQKMRSLLDEARFCVAKALGVDIKEVIFTSGASEANRLFCDSLNLWAKNLNRIKLVISPLEHPSLLKPILSLPHSVLRLDSEGKILDLSPLHDADVVIACGAHSETGILQDLSLIRSHMKKEAILMSDVTQSFARLSSFESIADIMSISAQKMGGYAGAGALILSKNAYDFPSPWPGGGQEKGFRPGTESSLMIASLGEAARVIENTRKENEKLIALRNYLEENLDKNFCVKIIGKNSPRLPNTLAVCFLNENPDALRINMDLFGLSVGFGFACSGLAPEGSFALNHLGLSLKEEKSTVRFSLSPENTLEEMDEVIFRLKNFLNVKNMG